MAAQVGVFVDEDHVKPPTFYWLPKLHKKQLGTFLLILAHVLLLRCL